jgi:hypothetical protein
VREVERVFVQRLFSVLLTFVLVIAVFIELAGLRQLGEALQSPADVAEYDLKWRPFLTALRALGGSFHTDADGSAHGTLTLAMGT